MFILQKTCCFKKSKSQRMLFFLPKKPDTSSQLLMFQLSSISNKNCAKKKSFFLVTIQIFSYQRILFCFFFRVICLMFLFSAICVIFLRIYLFSVDLGDFRKTQNFTDFSSRCSKRFKKDLQRFHVILQSCDF